MLNWFAVHPTSMNNTNPLISGDNKGYASQLFEQKMNQGFLPGEVKIKKVVWQFIINKIAANIINPSIFCFDQILLCFNYYFNFILIICLNFNGQEKSTYTKMHKCKVVIVFLVFFIFEKKANKDQCVFKEYEAE